MTEMLKISFPVDIARWLQARTEDEIRTRYEEMRPRPGLAHISHPAQAVLKTTLYRHFPAARSPAQ